MKQAISPAGAPKKGKASKDGNLSSRLPQWALPGCLMDSATYRGEPKIVWKWMNEIEVGEWMDLTVFHPIQPYQQAKRYGIRVQCRKLANGDTRIKRVE